jgi:hypothetical protein
MNLYEETYGIVYETTLNKYDITEYRISNKKMFLFHIKTLYQHE